MARKVPHQITFIAFTMHEDGTRSILDIVETSFHYASKFARGFMRDPMVSSFQACEPAKAIAGLRGVEWTRS